MSELNMSEQFIKQFIDSYKSMKAVEEKVKSTMGDKLFLYPCDEEKDFQWGDSLSQGFNKVIFKPRFDYAQDETIRFVTELCAMKPSFIFYTPIKLERDLKQDVPNIKETHGEYINFLYMLYKKFQSENDRVIYNKYVFVFPDKQLIVDVNGYSLWKICLYAQLNDFLYEEDESVLEVDEYDFDDDGAIIASNDILTRIAKMIAELPKFILQTNQDARVTFIEENFPNLDLSSIEDFDKLHLGQHEFYLIANIARNHFDTVVLPEKVLKLKNEGNSVKQISEKLGISVNRVRKINTALEVN